MVFSATTWRVKNAFEVSFFGGHFLPFFFQGRNMRRKKNRRRKLSRLTLPKFLADCIRPRYGVTKEIGNLLEHPWYQVRIFQLSSVRRGWIIVNFVHFRILEQKSVSGKLRKGKVTKSDTGKWIQWCSTINLFTQCNTEETSRMCHWTMSILSNRWTMYK